MTRVLLIGGSGDLGTAIDRQRQPGTELTCLDPAPPPWVPAAWHEGSVLDCDVLRASLDGVSVAVHIAAWHGIHESTGQRNREEFWRLNVDGAIHVFEAAAALPAPVPIVFISSTSVRNQQSFYGFTKRVAEDAARWYASRRLLRVITLRPRSFIPWWNRRVYPRFIDWANWYARGGVHVDDVARAVIQSTALVRERPFEDMPVLPIDGRNDYSESDLASWDVEGPGTTFRRVFPGFDEAAIGAGLDITARPNPLDISETRQLLGYEPAFGFRDVLSLLADPDSITKFDYNTAK